MSQTAQILNFLKDGNAITSLQALQRFGVMKAGGADMGLKTKWI